MSRPVIRPGISGGDGYCRDVRGKIICVGSTVVVANPDRRFRVEVVSEVRRERPPDWWTTVRFESGGWTTPDRVAVVR